MSLFGHGQNLPSPTGVLLPPLSQIWRHHCFMQFPNWIMLSSNTSYPSCYISFSCSQAIVLVSLYFFCSGYLNKFFPPSRTAVPMEVIWSLAVIFLQDKDINQRNIAPRQGKNVHSLIVNLWYYSSALQDIEIIRTV